VLLFMLKLCNGIRKLSPMLLDSNQMLLTEILLKDIVKLYSLIWSQRLTKKCVKVLIRMLVTTIKSHSQSVMLLLITLDFLTVTPMDLWLLLTVYLLILMKTLISLFILYLECKFLKFMLLKKITKLNSLGNSVLMTDNGKIYLQNTLIITCVMVVNMIHLLKKLLKLKQLQLNNTLQKNLNKTWKKLTILLLNLVKKLLNNLMQRLGTLLIFKVALKILLLLWVLYHSTVVTQLPWELRILPKNLLSSRFKNGNI
jgi:hypothetical protein